MDENAETHAVAGLRQSAKQILSHKEDMSPSRSLDGTVFRRCFFVSSDSPQPIRPGTDHGVRPAMQETLGCYASSSSSFSSRSRCMR